jgi:NADPH-dependent curcumin reductase
MTESKNRQWILKARPAGKLTGEEFLWNEAAVPRPCDGQVLIRTLWLSVDPAQRTWMARDSYSAARGRHAVLCRRAGARIPSS